MWYHQLDKEFKVAPSVTLCRGLPGDPMEPHKTILPLLRIKQGLYVNQVHEQDLGLKYTVHIVTIFPKLKL